MPIRKYHKGKTSMLKYLEIDLLRPTSYYKDIDCKLFRHSLHEGHYKKRGMLLYMTDQLQKSRATVQFTKSKTYLKVKSYFLEFLFKHTDIMLHYSYIKLFMLTIF